MVALLVMLNVVILVTMHYLTWNMTIEWGRLLQLRDGQLRRIFPSGKQRGVLMPSYSWMRSPSGSQVVLTALSCIKRCLHMLRWSDREYYRGIFQGHQQPSPDRSPQVKVSSMGLLTPQTTYEEILALYKKVYQLKRDSGEVQCSEDIVEETCAEILEVLREYLWCRQDPPQLERETRWDAFRMPAQVEYHTKVQATYDYFGCHHRIQQESCEEALWVVIDYHYQALAATAILEGHIEWLSCSISWGLHGSQSRRWSGSHQQLRSRRCSRRQGHSRSHWRCPQAGPQEQTLQVEGCPRDAPTRQTDSQAQYNLGGRETPPARCDPRSRQTPPALWDLSSRSPSKIPVWTPVWKQPSSLQTGLDG